MCNWKREGDLIQKQGNIDGLYFKIRKRTRGHWFKSYLNREEIKHYSLIMH